MMFEKFEKIDYKDFLFGGLASTFATVFTNPFEVIKTRIQLQGELAAQGTYATPYKSVLSGLRTIFKNEGILALQKGLVPAFYFQFIMNGSRYLPYTQVKIYRLGYKLGVYNSAMKNNLVQRSDTGKVSFLKGSFWGATGGILGSIISSPFFLLKTQLQSEAAPGVAVGYQHHHTSMTSAMRKIYSKNGIKGLWRGYQATIPRAVLGGSAQIGTFGTCKDFLKNREIVVGKTLNSFAAGTLSGTVMALAMTPPDVIATRLYNQGVDENGKGLYYKGTFDCFLKILKAEGIYGLYKGLWPNYLRIAPHTALVLLFFDELQDLWKLKLESK